MMRKLSAIYTLFIGICMIGMWSMFYFTDNIPELKTEPIEISIHITTEVITAICLMIAGLGLWLNKQWSHKLFLLSTGMVIYSMMNSSGYFLQQNQYGIPVMFASFIVLAVIFIIPYFKKENVLKR